MVNNSIPPELWGKIAPTTPAAPAQGIEKRGQQSSGGFAEALSAAVAERRDVGFSGHAMQRFKGQGVTLDADKVDRIADGIDKAAAKGSRDSLMLLDGLALVVSVKNRMVVTAISPERMREQVVTNIDSAVIL